MPQVGDCPVCRAFIFPVRTYVGTHIGAEWEMFLAMKTTELADHGEEMERRKEIEIRAHFAAPRGALRNEDLNNLEQRFPPHEGHMGTNDDPIPLDEDQPTPAHPSAATTNHEEQDTTDHREESPELVDRATRRGGHYYQPY